ncbi:MAG: sulfite oxidase [Chloroflexi bacterium OHK40]
MKSSDHTDEEVARSNILSGLIAATVQLTTCELVAALLPGGRSPTASMIRAATDRVPAPLVDAGVALLQMKAKPALNLSVVSTLLGAGALASAVGRRYQVLGGLVLGGGSVAALLAAAAQADNSKLRVGLISGAGGAAGMLALQLLWGARGASQVSSRAAFCVAYAVGAALFARWLSLRAEQQYEAHRQKLRLPRPDRSQLERGYAGDVAQTGSAGHYPIDVNASTPLIDVVDWRLHVHGLVEREVVLTLDELLAMPLVEIDATLVCIHNLVGGTRMGTARWLGVPVAQVLQQAGVRPAGSWLVATAVDGFSMALPLSLLKEAGVALIAVGMDGAPLPLRHGFPARLLVPATYGQEANLKWLAELRVTADAAEDYWSRRGWPEEPAGVQMQARIDTPRDGAVVSAGATVLCGKAWAQPIGVARVEVQIDGAGWHDAELGPALSPVAWRSWRLSWEAEPGLHTVVVRVTNAAGAVQVEEPRTYVPSGTTGYHCIRVHVVAGTATRQRTIRARASLIASWRTLCQRLHFVALNSVAWYRRRGQRG